MRALVAERHRTLAELKNNHEDLLLNLKEFTEMGILPSQARQEDYYDLLSVMGARPKDKRPELVDPVELLRNSKFRGEN
ncbi:hypothetical protein PT285_11185 [Lactobacillus sp. ESL0791]|uniref:hypothetical protein n=1 Tax=Lactobacillus sp. ESL0791 TaxID=2983234 RepID=UPI0023F6F122|nr:hypothetical protein [Lactobacillus sp. ESL0791]MDF7639965.1 hypothetical protein [Lactobacillus sp. ESL0791]